MKGRGEGAKGIGSGARLPGFEFQICHLLAVGLYWSLKLSVSQFPAYEVVIKIEFTYSRAVVRINDVLHKKHITPSMW